LFPLEHMALYVDVLTKECIDSHDKDVYKIIQKHMKKAGLDLSAINAIGFGNLAYIALHAKNEKMQKEAIKILEDVIELRQADIAEVLRVGKNAMDKNVN
jgi:ribosome recycling factor